MIVRLISLKTIFDFNVFFSSDVALLKTQDGQTIADLVALNIGQIGENMAVGAADVFYSKPGRLNT